MEFGRTRRSGDPREPLHPDIVVQPDGGGEFHLIRALTDRGRSWIRRNIPRAVLTPEGEVMIGPDYLPDLLAGIRADGMQVNLGE